MGNDPCVFALAIWVELHSLLTYGAKLKNYINVNDWLMAFVYLHNTTICGFTASANSLSVNLLIEQLCMIKLEMIWIWVLLNYDLWFILMDNCLQRLMLKHRFRYSISPRDSGLLIKNLKYWKTKWNLICFLFQEEIHLNFWMTKTILLLKNKMYTPRYIHKDSSVEQTCFSHQGRGQPNRSTNGIRNRFLLMIQNEYFVSLKKKSFKSIVQ